MTTLLSSVIAQQMFAQDALLEQITGESIPTPDLDRIEFYSEHPLRLDSATIEQLLELPYMTRSLARRIIAAMRNSPPRSVEELCQRIECTDEQRYVVQRCTRLHTAISMPFPITVRSRAMLWLTPPRAASDGRFRGNHHEFYNRVSAVFERTHVSALTNKDPGEPILAGDYYLEHGLGVIAWRPFAARKGTDVITPCTEVGRGFQQYRSAFEHRFFRGIATQHQVVLSDSIHLIARAGISWLPRSATIDTASQTIASLVTDGYHRTTTELLRRHSITEQAVMGNIELGARSYRIGVAVLSLAYLKPVTSSSTLVMPSQKGVFSSLFATYCIEPITLAVEIAGDYSGNIATRAGVEHTLGNATFALSARWYAPEFRAPFGYNFGEASQPTNESGVYLGLRIRWSKDVLHLFYADVYQAIVPTKTLPRIRRGNDVFNELRIRLARSTTLFVRLRQEHRTEDRTTETGSIAQEVLRTTLRCELYYTLLEQLTTRVRIEGVRRVPTDPTGSAELGVAGFVELVLMLSEQFTLGGRITTYQTLSFSSAVYSFEQLAPGLLVSVPLYGAGSRNFVWLQWRIAEHIRLWARYGATLRMNVSSLSSGLTEVPGTHDARLHIQLDVSL